MKVFVVLVEDRHEDPGAYVFSSADAAISFARDEAEERCHEQCWVTVKDPPDGWLFHATYCIEGDGLWVVEKTLDEPQRTGSPPSV